MQRAAGKAPHSLLAKGQITSTIRSIEVHPPPTHELREIETPPAEEATDAQHEAYCGLRVTRDQPHAIAAVVDICDPYGRKPGEQDYANEVIQVGDIIQKVC